MESKFYSKWNKLKEQGADLYRLENDNILVERLDEEEVKLGNTSLIMASDKMYKSEGVTGITARVLDVGRGYYDSEKDEYVPLDVKPGDIVLLSEYSVQFYRQFPGFTINTETRIGLTRESECKLVFKGLEAYNKAKEIINTEE